MSHSRLSVWEIIGRMVVKKRKQKGTFTKVWVARLMGASILWITLSYVLAFCGKIDIAEELSKTVITGIICVMLPYFAKSLFETKWEKELEFRREQQDFKIEEISSDQDDEASG